MRSIRKTSTNLCKDIFTTIVSLEPIIQMNCRLHSIQSHYAGTTNHTIFQPMKIYRNRPPSFHHRTILDHIYILPPTLSLKIGGKGQEDNYCDAMGYTGQKLVLLSRSFILCIMECHSVRRQNFEESSMSAAVEEAVVI